MEDELIYTPDCDKQKQKLNIGFQHNLQSNVPSLPDLHKILARFLNK